MPVEEQVVKWIEKNEDKILSDLCELIRRPSLTGEELCGQEWIMKKWGDMGLTLDVFEPNVRELFQRFPQYAQYPSSWIPELDMPLKFQDVCTYEQLAASEFAERLTYRNRPNVVGIKKGRGDGRSLILNGHVDVVTVGNRKSWSHDPFSAVRENGVIYGRGSCDMKGGLISMTAALEAVISCGVPLCGDVIMQSVVNEEHSGNGSLACVAKGYTADAVVCTEPSGSQAFSVVSGGGIYFDISVSGKEVHTGARWKDGKQDGISAIEKMAIVINELIGVEAELNRDGTVVSLGLGHIRGGTYATSTAASCTVSGVAYFSPALGHGDDGIKRVKTGLRRGITRACEKDGWLSRHSPELMFSHYTAAYQCDENSEIVKTLRESAASVLGKEIHPVAISSCDAGRIGNILRIPCIIYGPGNMALAHSVDEHIEETQVIEAAKAIALIVLRWCGSTEHSKVSTTDAVHNRA